jgi:hypothetical protein
MKGYRPLLKLAGVMGLLLLGIQSGFAQTLTYNYDYYQPGASPATRYPTRSAAAGRIVPIPGMQPLPGGTFGIGSQAIPLAAPSAPPVANYALAYVVVTGGAGGAVTVFPNASDSVPPSVPITVQSNVNIVVDVVYFPAGGAACTAPPCPTAASVDEFSETGNSLLNDWFVNVFSPPTATAADKGLTNSGNTYGSVATTPAAVRIQAMPNPAGGTFDRWVAGPGSTGWTVSGQNLTVNKQASVYALALYHSACPSSYVWSSTATISQCLAGPPPVVRPCPSGTSRDPDSGRCLPIVRPCPSICKFGCYTAEDPSVPDRTDCKPPPQ